MKGFDTEAELEEFNEQSELESAKEFVQRVRAAIVFGKPFHSGDVEDLKNTPDGRLDYIVRLPIYTIETRSSFPWIQFAGPSDGKLIKKKTAQFFMHGYSHVCPII